MLFERRNFMDPERDRRFMTKALEQAELARQMGEVPVGAVVVVNNAVVAACHNRRESDADPLAHAELLALREASSKLGGWRLSGAELYVTLEPCVMCAGAMVLARIDRLIFGAKDPKGGAAGSLFDIPNDERLNHRIEVVEGIEAEACSRILTDFFRQRRNESSGKL